MSDDIDVYRRTHAACTLLYILGDSFRTLSSERMTRKYCGHQECLEEGGRQ